MAYLDTWNLYNNSSVIYGRTAVAVAKAAQDILNEDVGTVNHANRMVWAKQALADAPSKAKQMMWAVIGNATIAAAGESCLDSDIQFVVNGNVDVFATGS